MTIQELQALYDEEKRKNEHKTRRIRQLEKIIRDLGMELPRDVLGASEGDLPSEPPPEETKTDISDALLQQAMEMVREQEQEKLAAEAEERKANEAPEEIVRVPTLDKES